MPPIQDVIMYELNLSGHVLTVSQLLFIIWIVCACAGLGIKLCRYIRLIRLIRKLPQSRNPALIRAWEHVRAKTSLSRDIRLAEVNLNISPFAIGLRHPVIVMPRGPFSYSEYEYILEHELLHCLHHDMLLKLLTDIFCTVYWWNPFIYFLKKETFDYIEIRNDKRMLRSMPEEQRDEYMECLVNATRRISSAPVDFALSFSREDYRSLKKRLRQISIYTDRPKRRLELAVFIVLFFFMGVCTSYTLEAYHPTPDGCFSLNEDNCYILEKDGIYEIYYMDMYFYETDSLEYFNSHIPVYTVNE